MANGYDSALFYRPIPGLTTSGAGGRSLRSRPGSPWLSRQLKQARSTRSMSLSPEGQRDDSRLCNVLRCSCFGADQLYPIDEMPNLSARLGKARTDRIRYVSRANPTPLARSRNIPNTLLDFMQDRGIGQPGCWVDDIIQGVARLDHYAGGKQQVPLSVSRLYTILQCMEMINTRELMAMMDVELRQAQVYVKALRLIINRIQRHIALTSGSTAV